MYARVAAFENFNVDMVDELIGNVRERVRTRRDLPEARGGLMLVDRERGKSLGITLFDSEEAIREAEPVFERMGDEIPEDLRGRRVSVDVYEVATHEGGEGAKAARVSFLEGAPDRIDEGQRFAEETILPAARQLSGWAGVLSLVDRASGRVTLVTLWESEDALRASEERADELRRQTAEGAEQTIRGVERYEVAVVEIPAAV